MSVTEAPVENVKDFLSNLDRELTIIFKEYADLKQARKTELEQLERTRAEELATYSLNYNAASKQLEYMKKRLEYENQRKNVPSLDKYSSKIEELLAEIKTNDEMYTETRKSYMEDIEKARKQYEEISAELDELVKFDENGDGKLTKIQSDNITKIQENFKELKLNLSNKLTELPENIVTQLNQTQIYSYNGPPSLNILKQQKV